MSHSEPQASFESSASVPAPQPTSGTGARWRARWPWAVLGAALVLGLAVGASLGLSGGALLAPSTSAAVVRPTILIAGAASPSAIVRSPLPAATAASATNAATPVADDEYVVAAGDTLRTVAQKVYGDADLWQRIYAANRDRIGPNPDALQAGMHLTIPRS